MHRPAMRAGWLALPLAFVIAFASVLIEIRPVAADIDLVIGGEARVSYTDGDSIRVRSTPSYEGSVVTSVPEGWLVAVLDGPVSDGEGSSWYKVTARGQTGYMVSDFLVSAGGAGSSSSSGESAAAAATMYTTTSLNLRSSAGLGGAILLVMPAGASVSTTGATQNGYSQLSYQGTTGWAASQYLSSSAPDSSNAGAVIANAWVVDGSLNLRSSASTSGSVLLVMPNNAQVGVTGSPQNGFTPVRYNGTNGWAYSQFLSSTQPGGNSGSVISNAWVTGGTLNLRSGASTSSAVLLVLPNGAQVGVTGLPQNGFTPVRYNGTNGWAYSQYLSSTQPGGNSGTVISNAWVINGTLNLRASSSTSSAVLLVLPDGAQVGVTGSPQNGFTPVRYNGTNGWAYSQFLSSTEPGDDEPEPTTVPATETRYATSSVNLRAGAGTSFNVLTVVPTGAAVTVTGSQANGFFPATYNGTSGYISANFLTSSQPAATPTPGNGNTGGLLVWPIKGGTWQIIQGYNGGTHQNRGSSADYYYSLDIQKTAGASATQGEPVYAPASGTVLWTSGGLLIGMGNGYGIAMFHITIDSSIRSGTEVTQGQYVGYISGPGGSGYQVTPHIDLTLWRLPNGGGSPRISTAFTGDFTISGTSLADIGTYNMHGGKTFSP